METFDNPLEAETERVETQSMAVSYHDLPVFESATNTNSDINGNFFDRGRAFFEESIFDPDAEVMREACATGNLATVKPVFISH